MGIMGNTPMQHHLNNIYSEVKRDMVIITNFEQLYDYVTCELSKTELNIYGFSKAQTIMIS